MARIYPLFSSSKGNCIYLGDSENGILIDCGVSFRRTSEALKSNGIPLTALRAVFITHTHSDHIGGLNTLLKKQGIPLYAYKENIEKLRDAGKIPETADCRVLTDTVEICGFTVKPFATSHDCKPSCAYRVRYPDGKQAAVCTDLGFADERIKTSLTGCTLVLLESNYDPKRLSCCSYPQELKKRISGREGHLSNTDCGKMLAQLAETGTTHFVLGHLSEESNTPELAKNTAVNALLPRVCGQDYLLTVAAPCGGKAIAF